MISDAIVYYSGIKFNFDAFDTPRYGIRFADAVHLLQTGLFGEGAEYDSKGNKVVGLFQGSVFATTDSLPSKDQVKIYDQIALGHTVLRDNFMKIQGPTVKMTSDYYKSANRGGLEKYLIGDAAKYHEVFFKKENGKIADSFTAKNPYDLAENLKDYERKYLKYVLWEMYKFKKNIPEEYRKMSEEEFSKSDKFKEYTKDSTYFEVPLMKKLDLNK